MSIVLLGLHLEKTRVAKYDTPAKRWQNKSLATDVRQSKADSKATNTAPSAAAAAAST